LNGAIGAAVYPASMTQVQGAAWFLARQGTEKVVGCLGPSGLKGRHVASLDGQDVTVGPTGEANARAVRQALPWTASRRLGLATSVGLGDRLGVATPGQLRAVCGSGLAPVLAQQSIREMTRTHRTPQEVIDAATWGAFQEGWREGLGSDADHLQDIADLDATVRAGFRMFTIDPGKHVASDTAAMDAARLEERVAGLDVEALKATAADLCRMYADKEFRLDGGETVRLSRLDLLRTLVKYGNAVAHTVRMYGRLAELAGEDFELEVSVDETDSPTSPAEHYFIAAELKRLGVRWVSLAPRFVGRFEKGVDYQGDLEAFRLGLRQHVAVMRTMGPYKLSIHSGSDKFSLYPILAEATQGLVHLKTAGTSYLVALQTVAAVEPELFREILEFARSCYDRDKASYHVSAEISRIPAGAALAEGQLAGLLEMHDARQVLHVTFGSVLTADGGRRFRPRILQALAAHEELHCAMLQEHIRRHLAPFRRTS
jgi:hypothetical protein